MIAKAIHEQRLAQQRLVGNRLAAAADVVGWLAAVQAQDFAGAKWALGLRTQDATDASVEKAFDDGAILRTHILRPTWHFVLPQDIRWIQSLTASRVNGVNAGMYRRLELDESVFARSNSIIAEALQGGRQLTREELGTALNAAGIAASGMRLGYIVHRAELDALVCSGPRRGKQFTYMLVDERVPQARMLAGDEALAELTRRYYTGHGLATLRDFAWWSGLTVTDAKKGVEMLGAELGKQEIDGDTYWHSQNLLFDSQAASPTLLLPTYDEFVIGFTGESRPNGEDARELIFDSMIILGGQVAGTWRRTVAKGRVTIEVKTLAPLSPDDDRIVAAADRYAAFVGMAWVLKSVAAVSEAKAMGWRRSRLANQDNEGLAG